MSEQTNAANDTIEPASPAMESKEEYEAAQAKAAEEAAKVAEFKKREKIISTFRHGDEELYNELAAMSPEERELYVHNQALFSIYGRAAQSLSPYVGVQFGQILPLEWLTDEEELEKMVKTYATQGLLIEEIKTVVPSRQDPSVVEPATLFRAEVHTHAGYIVTVRTNTLAECILGIVSVSFCEYLPPFNLFHNAIRQRFEVVDEYTWEEIYKVLEEFGVADSHVAKEATQEEIDALNGTSDDDGGDDSADADGDKAQGTDDQTKDN